MTEFFNINDLIYNVNVGVKNESKDGKYSTYKEVLDKVRHLISHNHSAELINVLYSESARDKLKNLIVRYLNQNRLSVSECNNISELADKIYEDMAGFGVLTKYITDIEVEEININSWNCIEVIYPDHVEMLPETFINPDDCMDKIKKMVWLGGSIIDGSNPKVDSFIGEGIRISAIIPPCVDKKTGGVASIRRQKENVISRELMISYGSATDDELDFLSLCVNNGVSLAIAGSTGSGKTTDLGYLLKSIDRNKRIYTIEDTRELNIAEINDSGKMVNRVIQTVTKDGVNPVTMDDLLKEALRFHPYAIIPAEMRGKEALTAVEAGRTGHIIISTLHANSAIDAYNRILSMCVSTGVRLSESKLLEFILEATIAPGGFGIASETVKENGRKVKQDSYTYLVNGNLQESRVQTGLDDYLITRYAYGGAYGGKYPTEVTTSGVKDADGAIDTYTSRYEYDFFGNVTKESDPVGNVKTYAYDSLGRLTLETLEDGKTRAYSYNDRDNLLNTTDANNKKLLYSYDKYGKIKSVADGADTLLKREYDSKKRIISETSASGAVTKYTYDKLDRYTSAVTYDTDKSVLSEQYLEYDDAYLCADGIYRLKLTVTEGNAVENRSTSYIFDRNENAIEQRLVSSDGDRIYSFGYDNLGNNILSVSPSGAQTKTSYDIFGNPIHIISADGLEQHFEYDFAGNIIREINGEGGEITRDFDSLSRVVSEETTNGTDRIISRSYYDYRGNVTKQIDPKGNKTEYEYDQRGFLSSVRQYSAGSEGIITEYEYDGEGNVTKYAYGGIGTTQRHTYQNVLDSYGRPVKTIDSIGNTKLFEYDLSGNVLKQTDEKGIVTQYTYNGLGNLLTQTNSQEGTITYEYNSFGEPIKIADNDETKEISYSNFGEVIKEVTGLQTNSYQYDEDGNLIKHIITDKDLEDYVTEYSYTKSGLVSSIKTGMGTETIAYDKAGRIKEKANEHTGFSKLYIYYPDNTIREIKTRMDGRLVYYENFAYDKNGNKIYDDQNGDIRKYTYDGLNRLTGAEIGNVRTEYEFDDYNNISKEYEIIGARIEKKSYYYDNANRLLLEDSNNRTVQYEYDNSGNLIKKITGIGSNAETAHYRYDGYNRLSEFIDDYSTAEYEYNINGLRKSKTVNGTKTRYIYNGADIVGEMFDDNIYTYYRATELIGYTNNKGDRYYYRQNSHGDVTALLTVDGQEKKTYSYNAYGKETPFILSPMGSQTVVQLWKAETEQVYNPFRYCGEYLDSETGLTYLRNRYYDNSIGRFITEDPIKDGLNWYVYCNNNPVMFVDPWGLKNVIVLVGTDMRSGDNAFLTNASTDKKEHSDDTVVVLRAWEYRNWKEIKNTMNASFAEGGIDALIIEAHASSTSITLCTPNSNPSYANIAIDKNDSWSDINFSDGANIRITGCNAGGMAGYKNVVTPIIRNENGKFVKYTGEMKDQKSIAQIIANKTGATVWAHTNYTSQKYVNGGYRQVAVNRYGEGNLTFVNTYRVRTGRFRTETIELHLPGQILGYHRFDKG